ncbi:hypothetical protein ACIA8R_29675 [Nonomuraea sp. NPDC051191]|uniref:hypothetical protein n=1 Tax=Nonomuraea sp. NPDC051191 TaxID=3364372 RepID=UPI0037974459
MTGAPAHYLRAVDELTTDPIVRKMATRLTDSSVAQSVNADGTLSYAFLRDSAAEYLRAGGQHRGPVGAVAHALLRLRAVAAPTAPDHLTPDESGEVAQQPEDEPTSGETATIALNDPRGCLSAHGPNCPHDRCDRYGCLLEGDCCQ